MPDLMPVFRKIDRSREHLEALQDSAKRFFDEHGDSIYRLHGESNSQRTKHLLRVELLRPLPTVEWGVIVGDAVHCLRTALDQLVFTLSLDPDDNAAWPVCRTEKEWVTKAPAMLWGVPKPLIAAIDRSQPYHRGNAANEHPLAILNSLSNTDKHKFIPVVALVPDDPEWELISTQGMESHGEVRLKAGRLLEDGAVVLEISFVPDDSGLELQMQMNGRMAFRVAFGKSGVPAAIAGKPLLPAFGEMGDAVQQAIADLHEVIREITAAGKTVFDF
jgi:hypothetical protein